MSENDPAYSFDLNGDGKRTILRLHDYRGTDDQLLRAAIGMTVTQAWNEMISGALDATAGLIWTMRRRGEPDLPYEAVVATFGYREYKTFRDADEDDIENARADYEDRAPEAVDADPEAVGAN